MVHSVRGQSTGRTLVLHLDLCQTVFYSACVHLSSIDKIYITCSRYCRASVGKRKGLVQLTGTLWAGERVLAPFRWRNVWNYSDFNDYCFRFRVTFATNTGGRVRTTAECRVIPEEDQHSYSQQVCRKSLLQVQWHSEAARVCGTGQVYWQLCTTTTTTTTTSRCQYLMNATRFVREKLAIAV